MKRVLQALMWAVLGFKLLRLEPGDVLVLSYGGKMTMEAVERLRSVVNHVAPEAGVLILQGGVEVEAVIRRPQARGQS